MLSQHISRLVQSKKRMLEIAASYEAPVLSHRGRPDSWTIPQVIEHLLIAETGILAFFRKYKPEQSTRKANMKSRIYGRLLRVWLKSSFRAKIPDSRLEPKGEKSLEQLSKEWAGIREGLMEVFNRFPDEKMDHTVFKHPIFGALTMPQSLDFMSDHIERHIRQIEEIARHYSQTRKLSA